MSNIAVIEQDIWSVEQTFSATCSDKSIRFEAEAAYAIQALAANDFAMSTAMNNRQSVINAVTNIAAIGISLNPALKQAYLVPRDRKICLDISYMGLMHLAIQSGAIRWAQCALVHAGDQFALAGLDKQPEHRFNPFATDRGEIIGVYCVVKTNGGDYLTHTMTISEVHDIRDKSSAWVAFQNKKTKSCIWEDFRGEMIKKTCVKQAYKYWPKSEQSGRLEAAVHYLNEQAGEGLHREERKDAGGVIKGTDGAMASLPIDQQSYIHELAAEAADLFASTGVAAVLDRIVADELDEIQTVALWSLLASDLRAALKLEKSERRKATEILKAA